MAEYANFPDLLITHGTHVLKSHIAAHKYEQYTCVINSLVN